MALNGPLADTMKLAAVHGINRYLWQGLSTDLGMRRIGTSPSLVPIIPTQQIPQVNQYAEPFLVYNWVTESQGVDWYFQTDQIVYVIYSEEEEELRQIFNYMRTTFERFDESAREVNEFLANEPRYSIFNYKFIQVLQGGGGALPAESEGGRQDSLIALRVMYTVDR